MCVDTRESTQEGNVENHYIYATYSETVVSHKKLGFISLLVEMLIAVMQLSVVSRLPFVRGI